MKNSLTIVVAALAILLAGAAVFEPDLLTDIRGMIRNVIETLPAGTESHVTDPEGSPESESHPPAPGKAVRSDLPRVAADGTADLTFVLDPIRASTALR